MTLWRFLVLASLLGVGYYFFKEEPYLQKIFDQAGRLAKFNTIRYSPGVLVHRTPNQVATRRPSFTKENFEIYPVANFSFQARVLSKASYWFDKQSKISPVDLVIGWGPMSDQSIVEKISFTQGVRLYSYDYKIPGFNVRNIVSNSANVHCIPADKNIENAIKNVKEGDIISASGYLVNVSGKNAWNWRTSLSRDDLGEDSTEIMWIERFVILTGSFPRVE